MKDQNPFVSDSITTKMIPYLTKRREGQIGGTLIALEPSIIDRDFRRMGFSIDFLDLVLQNNFSDKEMKMLFILITSIVRDKGSVKLVVKDIASLIGCSEETVRKARKKFEALELINKKEGRGNSNVYHVNPFLVFNGNRIRYLKSQGFKGLSHVKNI